MQELITILELIGKLAERFGPWLTTMILIGIAYFKYIRKGNVVVLKDTGGGKMRNGYKPGNGNGNEENSFCKFRALLCGEQIQICKDRLDKHDIRFEKGDDKIGLMHRDIGILLDRTKHLDPLLRKEIQ
jgi:hypothetical protein